MCTVLRTELHGEVPNSGTRWHQKRHQISTTHIGLTIPLGTRHYPLGGLPYAHCVDEKLQRPKIPTPYELYGSVAFKAPVWGIEKDSSIRLVASEEV